MKDLPDYTREMVIKYTGGFMGLEELATRLGFIGPADLRGNIVLMEDFESELTEWSVVFDYGGVTAGRSSRHKFSGDWSLKFDVSSSPTLGLGFRRNYSGPLSGKVGVFLRLCLDDDLDTFCTRIIVNKASISYMAQVTYDRPNATLSITTTGYSEYSVSTLFDWSAAYFNWAPILVTFNLDSGYYDKLYFGDHEFDISAIPLYTCGVGGQPEGEITLSVSNVAGVAFTTYVDDIIIAKNVP